MFKDGKKLPAEGQARDAKNDSDLHGAWSQEQQTFGQRIDPRREFRTNPLAQLRSMHFQVFSNSLGDELVGNLQPLAVRFRSAILRNDVLELQKIFQDLNQDVSQRQELQEVPELDPQLREQLEKERELEIDWESEMYGWAQEQRAIQEFNKRESFDQSLDRIEDQIKREKMLRMKALQKQKTLQRESVRQMVKSSRIMAAVIWRGSANFTMKTAEISERKQFYKAARAFIRRRSRRVAGRRYAVALMVKLMDREHKIALLRAKNLKIGESIKWPSRQENAIGFMYKNTDGEIKNVIAFTKQKVNKRLEDGTFSVQKEEAEYTYLSPHGMLHFDTEQEFQKYIKNNLAQQGSLQKPMLPFGSKYQQYKKQEKARERVIEIESGFIQNDTQVIDGLTLTRGVVDRQEMLTVSFNQAGEKETLQFQRVGDNYILYNNAEDHNNVMANFKNISDLVDFCKKMSDPQNEAESRARPSGP